MTQLQPRTEVVGERRTNWWLVVGGAILAVCGFAIFAAPGFFLEFLTVWAGVGFIVSGVAGVVSYIQLRRVKPAAGWDLFMAILDLVVGVLLVAHPFAFATIIPWMLGVFFAGFGILQIAGLVPFARFVPEVRAIAIVSGVLCVLVGIMLFVWPASLSIWVGAFALVRGITLAAMGVTARG